MDTAAFVTWLELHFPPTLRNAMFLQEFEVDGMVDDSGITQSPQSSNSRGLGTQGVAR